jgi:cell division protein FtsW (lipid II flippase)
MHLRRTSKKALAFAVGTAAAIFVCVFYNFTRVRCDHNVTLLLAWCLVSLCGHPINPKLK